MDNWQEISKIVKRENNLFKSLRLVVPKLNVKINLNDYPIIKNKYTKYKIYQDDLIEVIIISWDENVNTGFHKHPKNGCILKVLGGKLEENLLIKDNIINKKLEKDTISYIDDKIGIHSILSKELSYSLHIYSPPGFYDSI